jgi:hypothetical protein
MKNPLDSLWGTALCPKNGTVTFRLLRDSSS